MPDRDRRDDSYSDAHDYDMSDDERFTPPDPEDRWAQHEERAIAALERYERSVTREF